MRRVRPLREVALVAAAVLVYFGVRGVTEGSQTQALHNAGLVRRVQGVLGVDAEERLQAAALGVDGLITAMNWVYVWGHWPIILTTLAWLMVRHPEQYRLTRNALLISGAIGMVVFATFPVAPPRLADMELVDTISEQSQAYRYLQPPALTNQYAAVPSLHVGWNLLVGIVMARSARSRALQVIGVALPVAMVAAVVLTANHFVLDAAAGAAVALIGLVAATVLRPRERADRPHELPGSATAAPGTWTGRERHAHGAKAVQALPQISPTALGWAQRQRSP